MKSLFVLSLAAFAAALPSGHVSSDTVDGGEEAANHHIERRWGESREAVTCSFWKWSNAEVLGVGCRWVYNKSCWLNENGEDSSASGYCNRQTCCAPYPPTEGPVKDVFRYTCARYLAESGTECMGQLVSDANYVLTMHNCSWGTTQFVNYGLPVCSEDFCCQWVVIPYYITGENSNPDFNPNPNKQPLPNSPHSVDESVKKAGEVAILEENYLLTQPGNWRSLQKPGTVPPPTIGGTRPVPPAPQTPQDTFGPSNAEAVQLPPLNSTAAGARVAARGMSLDGDEQVTDQAAAVADVVSDGAVHYGAMAGKYDQ
eukprot:comp15780_c0_seq1/m.13019 comp15780_c0_seq1/g.13019  ORF comp15780_c0_seq1/g.13019 comp15780_c0_seq1/m.13019 type:complete len:314 (-) comp15780_c0_seq1:559-1500(-)